MKARYDPIRFLVQSVMQLRHVLSQRPDTEQAALILRYFLVLVIWCFIGFDSLFLQKLSADTYEKVMGATGLYCLGLALQTRHLAFAPEKQWGRLTAGLVSDFTLLTYFAFGLGETGSALYPFYLWLMLASGFRYGTPYLLASAIVTVIALSGHYHYFGLWETSYVVSFIQVAFVFVLALAMSSFLGTIREAIATAENASMAKSAFLAGVSHEVRTPLQAIKGLSDLLGDTRLDEEQRRMVGTISESGQSLLNLINHLLDYARTEDGKMPIREETFDLFVLSGRLNRLFSAEVNRKSLVLNFHVDPALRRLYHGNLRFLEDILHNLLGNAIKFTQQGRITLRMQLLEESLREHRICFEVIDTGIGIESDAQSRIFDRFTQSSDEVLDTFGGSGLGLALCRQYADLMGGRIHVCSTPGQGSTFAFEVSFGLVLKKNRALLAGMEAENAGGHPIVLVSDNPAVEGLLPHGTIRSTCYDNLDLALHKLAALPYADRPPLILIDRAACSYDIALTQKQVTVFGGSPPPQILWICRDDEKPANLARVHPQHGLAFVSRNDLQYRVCKLLRLAEQLRGQTGRLPAQQSLKAEGGAPSLHILVADDNQTNLMVLEKMLDSLGHKAHLAVNGEEAIAAIRSEAFDLAFLDIRMPVLDGLEMARRLMAMNKEGLPQGCPQLYALTADPTMEMEARCRQAGMSACLLKPIERNRMKELLTHFVEQKQLSADSKMDTDISDNWGLEEMFSSQVIEDLRDLGGDQFVVDLAHQFSEDGILALQRLKRAVNDRDDEDFRNGAHALRSAAANIGARSVFDLCLSWRDMTAAELDQEGAGHMVQLVDNLSEAIGDLEHILTITLPKPEPVQQGLHQREKIVNH